MTTKNDLDEILAHYYNQVEEEFGRCNISEIARRSGITRDRVERWVKNGCKSLDKAGGRPKGSQKLAPYTGELEKLLKQGTSNANYCYKRLCQIGYQGGVTIIRDFIREHRNLIPIKAPAEAKPKNIGRRYTTEGGDCFQMDWGFVKVASDYKDYFQCTCFVMVCHHCGYCYVEFFPNAKQENLFIGMLHAFKEMGVPKRVLTDNMKSIRSGSDAEGKPIFNLEYDAFQHDVGFRTDLCKPYHPFTKGKVERLIRYVKNNFICNRRYDNLTVLNEDVYAWCKEQNKRVARYQEIMPQHEHFQNEEFKQLPTLDVLLPYLAPKRKVSFDGFVEYEGRRYGIAYYRRAREVRVMREGTSLKILDLSTYDVLEEYIVDWSKHVKIAPEQFMTEPDGQPEELPTAEVTVSMILNDKYEPNNRFNRFRFENVNEEDER